MLIIEYGHCTNSPGHVIGHNSPQREKKNDDDNNNNNKIKYTVHLEANILFMQLQRIWCSYPKSVSFL